MTSIEQSIYDAIFVNEPLLYWDLESPEVQDLAQRLVQRIASAVKGTSNRFVEPEEGAVVIDCHGYAWQRLGDSWCLAGDGQGYTWDDVVKVIPGKISLARLPEPVVVWWPGKSLNEADMDSLIDYLIDTYGTTEVSDEQLIDSVRGIARN